MKAKPIPHVALVFVVGAGLTLGACKPIAVPTSHATSTDGEGWAKIDHGLAELGPKVGLLAASVSPDGTCRPVHEVASSTARPTASQFKLFVLGALANQIAAGRISWDQTLTVKDAVKSVGNGPGSLQFAAAGTEVSVEEAATKMISISDNTAADMLIGLVGRERVEAQVRQWTANASANEPFLTTREMFLLHYVAGLGDRYLATPRGEREAFLASSVDPLPLSAIASGFSMDPRYVEEIEWFASPMTSAALSPACRGCRRTRVVSLVHDSFPASGRDRTGPVRVAHGLVQGRLRARRAHPRLARHQPSRKDLRRRGHGVESRCRPVRGFDHGPRGSRQDAFGLLG